MGDRYVFIPVHPWQWEHQLESVYARQLMDGDIVYLGPSSSPYRAQQSIRSLSNRVNPEAPLHQAGPQHYQHVEHPYSGTAYDPERAIDQRLAE
ncbi:IucA/IucC family protein [Paenibacillus amylolyticus]|nr:IucA/IucC family protein [Paenibacillus amylolyticus]